MQLHIILLLIVSVLFACNFHCSGQVAPNATIRPHVVYERHNKLPDSKNNIPRKVSFHKPEIPHDQIQNLPPYKDMASINPKEKIDLNSPIEMMLQDVTDKSIFELDYTAERLIIISPTIYYGLILGMTIFGMLACFFLCSLVKTRIQCSNRFSYLKMNEK